MQNPLETDEEQQRAGRHLLSKEEEMEVKKGRIS